MTQILVTKPGVLNQRDRSALRRAGVVCVEADQPGDVKLISADGPELAGGDLALAALRAISGDRLSNNVAEAFPKILLAALEDHRAILRGEVGGSPGG